MFIAFLIGFVDGDGCIDKLGCIHVQCHSSWRETLELWFNRLYSISNPKIKNKTFKKLIKCGIDKRDGSVRVEIYNSEVLTFLKEKALTLNLPIIKRKWERIVPRP